MTQNYVLVFDTETTGLPPRYRRDDPHQWPNLVQLAWTLHADDGREVRARETLIRPDGWEIPQVAVDVHGITTEQALQEGQRERPVLQEFLQDARLAQTAVAHNVTFDVGVLSAALDRHNLPQPRIGVRCTMTHGAHLLQLPGPLGFKWPTLDELHRHLFGEGVEGAHDALNDVRATARCYFEMKRQGLV